MKAILFLAVLGTFVLMILQYLKNKNIKKLLISLLSMAVIVGLGVAGMLTRSVPPIFFAHLMLIVVSWGALLFYMFRGRYYWYLILSPSVTIALFWILALTEGSRYN